MKKIISISVICFLFIFSGCYFNNTPLVLNEAGFHIAKNSPFLPSAANGNQGEKITGMANDGKKVVAVGEEGTIAFSPDSGQSWTQLPAVLPAGEGFNAVTWGEGYFLAVGYEGRAAWSRDGVSWKADIIGPMSPKDIKCAAIGRMFGSVVFAAAGTSGRMAIATGSPEGPWYMADQTPFGDDDNYGDTVYCLAFGVIQGSGVFVAGGTRGRIAILEDLSGKWYGARAGTDKTFRSAAFGNDRFVVVGDDGLIKISANPKKYTWTTGPNRPFEYRAFPGIAFHPLVKHFVVFTGDNAVGISEYAEDWNAIMFAQHFPTNEKISAITCTGERIILAGSHGKILYSN